MTDLEIDQIIRQLGDSSLADYNRRDQTVNSLIRHDADAIEPLCKALEDKNWQVRWKAAEVLGKIGDAAAIEPLSKVLEDNKQPVRFYAVEALGKLGPAAIKPLCRALEDENEYVRHIAAEALIKIGDENTLPKKVLTETPLTAQQRFGALNALQRVRYKDEKRVLHYPLPDIRKYCQQKLQDPDEIVRQGAQTVLDVSGLLISSQRDETTEKGELLRGATSSASAVVSEELLRASDKVETPSPKPQKRRGVLARLFGRSRG